MIIAYTISSSYARTKVRSAGAVAIRAVVAATLLSCCGSMMCCTRTDVLSESRPPRSASSTSPSGSYALICVPATPVNTQPSPSHHPAIARPSPSHRPAIAQPSPGHCPAIAHPTNGSLSSLSRWSNPVVLAIGIPQSRSENSPVLAVLQSSTSTSLQTCLLCC